MWATKICVLFWFVIALISSLSDNYDLVLPYFFNNRPPKKISRFLRNMVCKEHSCAHTYFGIKGTLEESQHTTAQGPTV